MKKIIIATRRSPLALQQSTIVKNMLLDRSPNLNIEFLELTTQGDRDLERPLLELGGKSLFVKELQSAVLNNQADIAVHSVKDMSVYHCPGLKLTAITKREDPRDAFISNQYSTFSDLPKAAVIGTSSPRRMCQLKFLRPDLMFKTIRGNVGTRLNKLDHGEYDAIILAAAGLNRLHQSAIIKEYFNTEQMIPAIGQAALGIECRENDAEIYELIAMLNHRETALCVTAERAVNQKLGGDCKTAIGAFAQIKNEQLHLQAMVGSMDGSIILKSYHYSTCENPQSLGNQVAEDLIAQGAEQLIFGARKC